jgi:hypothetical protein
MLVRKIEPRKFAMTFDGLFVISSSRSFGRIKFSYYVSVNFGSPDIFAVLDLTDTFVSRFIIALWAAVLAILSCIGRAKIIAATVQSYAVDMVSTQVSKFLTKDSVKQNSFLLSIHRNGSHSISLSPTFVFAYKPLPLHQPDVVSLVNDGEKPLAKGKQAAIDASNFEWNSIFQNWSDAIRMTYFVFVILTFYKFIGDTVLRVGRANLDDIRYITATALAKAFGYIDCRGCHDRVSSRSGSSGMLKHPAPLLYLLQGVL